MNDDELYTISNLAEKANVNIQTIRFYERKNLLLPKVRKDSKKIRFYDKESLDTLLFIKNSQSLGFQLEEIKELLKFKAPTSADCSGVKKMAVEKLVQVKDKLEILLEIERRLTYLISECEQKSEQQPCPITTSLFSNNTYR